MAPLPELMVRPQRPLLLKYVAFIRSVTVILLTDPTICKLGTLPIIYILFFFQDDIRIGMAICTQGGRAFGDHYIRCNQTTIKGKDYFLEEVATISEWPLYPWPLYPECTVYLCIYLFGITDCRITLLIEK